MIGVVAKGYGTCCCHLLSVWLLLCYYLIYIAFYFELADDIYSVLVLVLTPTCMFLSLLFVECSKRAIVFNSSSVLANLYRARFQGELLFLARTRFFPLRLDVLKFGHGASLLLILAS